MVVYEGSDYAFSAFFVMAYQVRIEKFEGPLDVLLRLIEKEKLDITQVSLAQVTDQYLLYLKDNHTISLENLSFFLTVASRLILIKSRALLPVLQFSDEEEEAMEHLETHLKTYKLFKEVSSKLGVLMTQVGSAYAREGFLGATVVYYPPKGISQAVLRAHFLDVLGGIPLMEQLPEKELLLTVTLEEKIAHFKESITRRVESSFHELIRKAENKVEVIVSFLALLELIKQRFIHVEQKECLSNIHIKRLSDTP